MKWDRAAIDALPQRYRAHLINSATGFKPANLVATAGADGNCNLAIVSSVVHLGAQPPLVGMIVRPAPPGTERHSLDNIRATGSYSINHVNDGIIAAAHQTSARYPRDVSEFEATGLTPVWIAGFPAPFVAEADIHLGLSLCEIIDITRNGTHMVIGEIQQLAVPDAALRDDGSIDLSAAGSAVVGGLDSYHSASPPRRFAYAKPGVPPQELD